jgi:hypothetical protein
MEIRRPINRNFLQEIYSVFTTFVVDLSVLNEHLIVGDVFGPYATVVSAGVIDCENFKLLELDIRRVQILDYFNRVQLGDKIFCK